MSASLQRLLLAPILLGLALSACHNEDASPGSAPAAPDTPVTPATYSVSATVSGLNGSGLVLQNNGGGSVTVTANGTVTFASQASGTAYAVTVQTQPSGPAQTCTVAGGSGTIAQANVTNVTVTCTNNYVPTYAPAAKGDPQGTVTTQMIDAAGGSVTSADGRLTLNIPAGALASATAFSVQPITNTTPNGMGVGYRLEPEGTTFAAPVTLTFHLSATDTPSIDSVFVTTQHDDGYWYSQPNQQRDPNAQTVSVATTHFSDWSIAQTLYLDPKETRVRINTTATFTAYVEILATDDDELANPDLELRLALPVPLTDQVDIDASELWAVDSILGGNSQVGTLFALRTTAQGTMEYQAPASVPSPSDVAVSVTLQLGKKKVIALSDVTIFNQEFWAGTTDVTQIDGTQIHADVTFMQKLEATQSLTVLHFVVQSGVVSVKIPPMNGGGCSQSVSPDTRPIGAADPTTFEGGDGSMNLTYSQSTGPEDADVTGGGTTAWPATLTTVCDNGTLVLDTTEAAPWWPFNAGQTLTATNGVLDGTVSNALGSGTIHLVRHY